MSNFYIQFEVNKAKRKQPTTHALCEKSVQDDHARSPAETFPRDFNALVRSDENAQDKVMPPHEVKALRNQFGLSQREMSKLLHIGEKSYTRWENGRSRPTRSMSLLLRALRDGRIGPEYSMGDDSNNPLFRDQATFSQSKFFFVGFGASFHRPRNEIHSESRIYPSLARSEASICDQRQRVPANKVKELDILVDLDRLEDPLKRAGIAMLCTRIVNTIASVQNTFPLRCKLRLYGGWYAASRLTPYAEKVIRELDEYKNALVAYWHTASAQGSTIANIEMVYSLAINPQDTLAWFNNKYDVLIEKCLPERARDVGCSPVRTSPEKADPFHKDDLFRTNSSFSLQEGNRELIDSMMIADLVYLAATGFSDLAIVSPYQGLWPGMITALLLGAHIIHMDTTGSSMPQAKSIGGTCFYKHTLIT